MTAIFDSLSPLMPPPLLVYALVDPRSLLVRYVGKSKNGFSRPLAHWSAAKYEAAAKLGVTAWVNELRAAGLYYTIAVLEVVDTPARLLPAERWWIAFGRACGWPLTNEASPIGCPRNPPGTPPVSQYERRARKA